MRIAILALAGLCVAAQAEALKPDASPAANPHFRAGRSALQAALKRVPNKRQAKNVILFIGDGMGINSVSAGRIFMDQKKGGNGVESKLFFESLPYSAFAQTHSADQYVTDSANGITMMTAGVKTVNGAIGMDDNVERGICVDSQWARVPTLFELAKRRGFATGIVTDAGITDATPAGAYGHTPDRRWRNDADLTEEARVDGCHDLARQLVEAPADIRLDVALGGDRYYFLPMGGEPIGMRADGRNLVQSWLKQSPGAAYADSAESLSKIDAKKVDHLLGLFADDKLPSVVDQDWHQGVPTLEDMTRKAIAVLKNRKRKGFVLMVEAASIDKWHHRNNAYRALTDVGELDKAVKAAREMTNPDDTLIIVTADHDQAMTFMGSMVIGKPVLGLAHNGFYFSRDMQGNPYTAVGYTSGPGEGATEDEPVLTQKRVLNPNYNQKAGVPMQSSQHSGADVPVYADGPKAYLISGSMDMTYLYQVMAHALGLDRPATPVQPQNARKSKK